MISQPYYWKNEQSGALQKMVIKFLNDTWLYPVELYYIKSYIRQWIKRCFDYEKSKGKHREDLVDLLIKIELIKTQNELKDFIDFDCKQSNINPF
ncbi:MAG: hypothetical protein ABIA91_03245 [Patescibacteria group bacterium]